MKNIYSILAVVFFQVQLVFTQVPIKQVVIPVGDRMIDSVIGNDDDLIGPGLPNFMMRIDRNMNLFLVDGLSHSIKKFDMNGKYLGRIHLRFIPNINCYKNNLFTGAFFNRDNRMFVYDTDSLTLKRTPRQLFNDHPIWMYRSFDKILVFYLPYDKYNVYNMENNKVRLSVSNPFVDSCYSNKEQEFLMLHFSKDVPYKNICYLGKVNDNLVLIKSSDIKNEYILAIFDLKNRKKLETKISIRRDKLMNDDLFDTSVLKKNRYLAIAGYQSSKNKFDNKGKIIVYFYDLKQFFPDINFPEVHLFDRQNGN